MSPRVRVFRQANLPLLQRELLHCAHLARQSPHQYLMHHDRSVLDASAPVQQPGGQRSPRDDRAVTAAIQETSPPAAVTLGSKKRKSPDDRYCQGHHRLTVPYSSITNKCVNEAICIRPHTSMSIK